MRVIFCCLGIVLCVPAVFAQSPIVTDSRIALELVAEQPDLVTPTGLAVDEKGRVWVIENHTHQRPASYQGPPTDRVRVFSDFDATGKARKVATVADGFRDTMSIALGKNGNVFLATRSTIFLLHFQDGKPPERKTLVQLETKGNYPHNGLAGFAFDGLGNMYFGLGENLGAAYKLIGSDGTTLEGGGEGGSMYVCRPDGSKLQRIATGFWNPFHHWRTDAKAQDFLARLAADSAKDIALRADAVAGLAQSAPESAPARKLLFSLLDQPKLRRDALHSLRGTAIQPETERALLSWWEKLSPADRREIAASFGLAMKSSKSVESEKQRKEIAALAGPRPRDETGWQAVLARGGDPEAGERVFFHVNGPRCYVCHRVDGRGGKIGPDLSAIGRALSRNKLITSILTPSKEIAPQFVAWSIVTRDGKVRNALIVEEKFDSSVILADSQGKLEAIKRQDIEERHALATSIMPDNLHELMTPREFLDLIAFLSERK